MPAPQLLVPGRLSAAQAAEVLDLVAAAAAVDGGDPIAEDARLALRDAPTPGDPERVMHVLARRGPAGEPESGPAGALTGYAQARTAQAGHGPTTTTTTVELLVHPGARGRGVGAALADDLARRLRGATDPPAGTVHAWSHTDSPGAAALARRLGLRRSRELWRMERTLGDPGSDRHPAGDPPDPALPEGVVLRAFEPGRDEDAWLALNARAFATHPEQGAWGRADLDARTAEPWFDPAGLLLAVDAHDPDRLLASHWTKVERPGHGEVYVVAVDPAAQGRGLGRAVVLAGLHHLARRGVRVVDLYTDADNTAATRTYTRLGFARVATDVVYEGTA